jgi:hypothetical protein
MVVPDVGGQAARAGIYVMADRIAAMSGRPQRGCFPAPARMQVKAPAGLGDLVEALLARRVVELLSMARKAGQAVVGYEKVKDWLADGARRPC